MLTSRVIGIAALAGFLACGDGGTAPNPDELAGTWDGTKVEFINEANPAQRVDVIAAGGSYVLVLQSAGSYQGTLTVPGEAPMVATGTWSASADIFTMNETGTSGDMQFDYSRSGATLTLSGANTDWDFNDDGVDEPAKVTVVLVKR
jgi:hypothetical protein